MHVRAALRNGLTTAEIGEVLLQSAVYCGVPAANGAFAVAQRVLRKRRPEPARADGACHCSPGQAADEPRVVLSAVRTPIGRYGGALAGVRPDDLAALVVAEAVERAGVPAGRSRTSGSAARTRRARTTATSRGSPRCWRGCRSPSPASTVNRLCASGLAAVVGACHAVDRRRRRPVRRGRRRVDEPGAARHREAATRRSPAATARCTTRRSAGASSTPATRSATRATSMGETGENVAERWGVSREDQDAFAAPRTRAGPPPQAGGRFADELVGGRRRRRSTSTRGRARPPRSSRR